MKAKLTTFARKSLHCGLNFGSAEGNRKEIHAPQIFAANGKVFVVYSNKKTDIQISELPSALLKGLQQQRTAGTVKTSNLVVWMEAADFRNGSAKVPPHIISGWTSTPLI